MIKPMFDAPLKCPVHQSETMIPGTCWLTLLAAGMDDYITKPIRPGELTSLLARYSSKNFAGRLV